ncbi:unnamed protein product [Bursaphelenchus xylophilus]|uniref:(pine wood nematode) hypothetical protein n=1 Tax=Bursaphelenchus xylophilus TaxID=6326 RepID=A0A1I7SJ36_BURXY|nr:unnamed protein product [Bursaphelenchus xylophilus]CAG9104579.1 unnamed protein product [Bursaphelenchus xylophilus]
MWAPTILLLVGFAVVSADILPTKWSVVAIGKLLCNGKPIEGKVSLYDKDNAFDDLLDTDNTTANGKYYVEGSDKEWSRIEPYLEIIHQCNGKRVDRKVKVVIPKEFVYRENDSKRTPVYIKDHELSDEATNEGPESTTTSKPVEAQTYLTKVDVLPEKIIFGKKEKNVV